MAHQTTITSTTSISSGGTNTTGPTVASEHSIGVSITTQSGSETTFISVSNLSNCTVSGSAGSYTLTVNSGLSSGTYAATFSNTYNTEFSLIAKSNISGSITASPSPTAPTISTSQTFPSSETASGTASVALSSAGTGNASDVFQYALFPVGSGSNFSVNNSFNVTRNTSYYFGASRQRADGTDRVFATNQYVGPILFPYLPPDTSANINATSSSITAGATSASTTVSGVTGTGMQVAIALNNGTTNLGPARVGNGTLTFTPATTTGATTYEVFTARPVANGGNNVWTQTNNTFTVTRAAPSDTTPNQFSFTDVSSNVAVSSTQTSNTITVGGINAATNVTISGGTYSKNSGGYTSNLTTAVLGDTFSVRHTASSSNSTAVNTTLTIGGVSDTFTSTTVAAASDTTPNAFSFATQDVTTTTNTSTTTTAVNLLGYDAATSLTAITSGAEFSINNGTFSSTVPTSVPTTANIKLRATSSSSPSTALAFNVTIGGVTSGDWTITTAASTGGGGSTGGAGTSTYGLQINNDAGTTVIFSPSMRASNLIRVGEATIAGVTSSGVYSSATFTAEGVTPNNSTEVAVMVAQITPIGSSFGSNAVVDVDRLTNQVKLTNKQGSEVTYKYLIYRY